MEDDPKRNYMALDGKFLLALTFAVGFIAAMLLERPIPESIQVLGSGVILAVLGVSAAQWQVKR